MIGRMHHTICPACRHDVPVGRWCNWCGAGLQAPTPTRSRPQVSTRGVATAMAGLVVAAIAWVGWGSVSESVPTRTPPSAVVLPDEAAAFRPGRVVAARPGEPPAERADVICSDLRVRSVPVSELTTDVPGELVELANGTCVVMGPEGAVAP